MCKHINACRRHHAAYNRKWKIKTIFGRGSYKKNPMHTEHTRTHLLFCRWLLIHKWEWVSVWIVRLFVRSCWLCFLLFFHFISIILWFILFFDTRASQACRKYNAIEMKQPDTHKYQVSYNTDAKKRKFNFISLYFCVCVFFCITIVAMHDSSFLFHGAHIITRILLIIQRMHTKICVGYRFLFHWFERVFNAFQSISDWKEDWNIHKIRIDRAFKMGEQLLQIHISQMQCIPISNIDCIRSHFVESIVV